MIYLTYSDPLTGVYQSQVIDVCNYISKTFNHKVRLVAIISIRGFWNSRSKIKSLSSNAIVLPMFPTILLWKLNIITLFFTSLFTGEKVMMARGVLACNMAIALKSIGLISKVCYDGRAAYGAEYEEYEVTPYKSLIKMVKQSERLSVINSDYRIAVSTKLIAYWKNNFDYNSTNHVIIPSTVNSKWKIQPSTKNERDALREKLNLSKDKTILVYSGSSAGWQSFDLLSNFIAEILENNKSVQFLFLAQSSPQLTDFHERFQNNFVEKWVSHSEVEKYLMACDYGVLIRDDSITNKVASPVKFAEYLFSGLNVIVSNNIGDISEFVKQNKCGYVKNINTSIELSPVNDETRKRNNELAKKFFTKESHYYKYKICVDYLLN